MPAIIKNDVVYAGGSTDIVDNLDSTDTDKALSANMGRELKEDLPIIEKDGYWTIYKYSNGYYRAENAWTTGNEVAVTTAYGNLFISQAFQLNLPQNIKNVIKVSGNTTYLGGGIGGVSMSDSRDTIDNLRDVNFYLWSATSLTKRIDVHFTCYGEWK